MKKFVSIALILILVIGVCFSGCSESKDTGNKNNETTPAAATSEVTTTQVQTEAPKPLYKIDYYQANTTATEAFMSDSLEVGKLIKEKFNIAFNFINFSGNWDEKCALMLAAGDYPEIIQLNTEKLIKSYMDAGALVKLDDLIKSSGPDFNKFYKESLLLYRLTANDEGIYFFNPNHEFSRLKYPINDLMVRSDALEAAGWPRLLNEDDYYAFIKESLQKFPTTNGKKTVGLTGCLGEPWAIATFTGPNKGNNKSASMVISYENDKKAYSDFMACPEGKEEFKFFNRLYREGLLDKECFADKYDQTNAKANEGLALVVWYTQWMRDTANVGFESAGKPEMSYVAFPMRLKSQTNQPRAVSVLRGGAGYNSICITKNCKDPEQIMQLINYLSTEEGIYLNGWGVEGSTYKVVNGKKAPADGFMADVNSLGMAEARKKYGIGIFDNFLAPGNLGNDANLNSYDIQLADEFLVQGLSDRVKTVLGKYGWTQVQDPWFNNPDQPFEMINFGTTGVSLVPDSEIAKINTKINDYTAQNVFKLMMCKTEAEFDQLWDEMTKRRVELGLQQVIDELNKQLKSSKERIDALRAKFN